MKALLNGITLYYEKTGSGPPLLLLHGNGGTLHTFDEALPELSTHYTVYAVDSRAHGQSTKTTEISYNLMAEDTAGLIDFLGLDKPLVLGFSDGGIIGLILSIRYPDKLSGLVAAGVNRNPRGLRAAVRLAMRLAYRREPSALLGMMLREPEISDEALMGIRIPVTVSGGTFDLIRRRHLREIASLIPGARFRHIPFQSHGGYMKDGKLLVKLLRETCEAAASPEVE